MPMPSKFVDAGAPAGGCAPAGDVDNITHPTKNLNPFNRKDINQR